VKPRRKRLRRKPRRKRPRRKPRRRRSKKRRTRVEIEPSALAEVRYIFKKRSGSNLKNHAATTII